MPKTLDSRYLNFFSLGTIKSTVHDIKNVHARANVTPYDIINYNSLD
jgi:hypothetical protein